LQIELGDAVACQLFCTTVYPDGIAGAASNDLHEIDHVGFDVRNSTKPPLKCGEGDFGTYLGEQHLDLVDATNTPIAGHRWWVVVVKELSFNGYKSAILYSSFEEVKSLWTLDL